jgi:UDP-N-acetyl-D-galactosamine dehydrogenase
MRSIDDLRISVIGLGYVGLPLAVAFGRSIDTLGFDIREQRVAELRNGRDYTLEIEPQELADAARLAFSSDPEALRGRDVYIVTVPTPIDRYKRPDLSPLQAASRTVGRALTPDALVIYESTVYPGATEEICVPLLEAESGLQLNRDFFVGYSPERINPGDREHRVDSIVKITSGSTPEAAELVDSLYRRVVRVGTHKAPSIRVAEAAKVIENTQRDVNIALINELAMIFRRLDIDTEAVLKAAGTKWNFLAFRPGLVGGHCIGVDPYYLTHKAQEIGFHPEMVLAGRRINDGMGLYVASELVKLMTRRRIRVAGSRVLVLGLTFKENCPDLRNTRVVDVVRELESFGAQVDVHDPWVDPEEAKTEYGIEPAPLPEQPLYDAIVLAVAHDRFRAMGAKAIRGLGHEGAVVYDLKYLLPGEEADLRL